MLGWLYLISLVVCEVSLGILRQNREKLPKGWMVRFLIGFE